MEPHSTPQNRPPTPAETEAACRAAIQRNPADFQAYYALGAVLAFQEKFDEANAAFSKSLTFRPDWERPYEALAKSHLRLGRLEEAISAARQAVALKPDFVEGWDALGAALAAKTELDGAIAAYRNAIHLRPDAAGPHWNLALALLLKGEFAEGWEEYEWRFGVEGFPVPRFKFTQPRWNGEPLEGKRILVFCEQGMGDAIQFVRYVPMVAARGGRVVMVGPMELFNLLQSVQGVEEVVWPGPWPAFDWQCPLLSLPRIFQTRHETIPANIPYVKADGARAEEWKEKLRPCGDQKKVGLVWAGRPNYGNDRDRSIRLEQLSALGGDDRIALVSLQKGDAAKQTRGTNLLDLSTDLHDFADTAALIANLDLVISVDTAVAHLAGAMGKPVWLLLPFAPDWRWGLNRADSAWYPTMRLFRQKVRGDWGGPIAEVAAALRLS